jgi:hypothetical protein
VNKPINHRKDTTMRTTRAKVCLMFFAFIAVLALVAGPAMAGEGSYMGIVGMDSVPGPTNILQADPPGRPCPVPPCAAETDVRLGLGTCVRQDVDPGISPVINTALPKITRMDVFKSNLLNG